MDPSKKKLHQGLWTKDGTWGKYACEGDWEELPDIAIVLDGMSFKTLPERKMIYVYRNESEQYQTTCLTNDSAKQGLNMNEVNGAWR